MNCPHGHAVLLMSERQGVEVDYCPECRGVWLDRGELDKIIERSVAEVAAGRTGSSDDRDRGREREGDRERYRDRGDDDRDDRRRDEDAIMWERSRSGGTYPKKKHKKRSFLEDIFDF